MPTATVALAPGEAITAAMRELYDRLQEIVDRSPADDPGVLDELGKLTGRIRRVITRARKQAIVAKQTSESPAQPKPATAPSKPTGEPAAANKSASKPAKPAPQPSAPNKPTPAPNTTSSTKKEPAAQSKRPQPARTPATTPRSTTVTIPRGTSRLTSGTTSTSMLIPPRRWGMPHWPLPVLLVVAVLLVALPLTAGWTGAATGGITVALAALVHRYRHRTTPRKEPS